MTILKNHTDWDLNPSFGAFNGGLRLQDDDADVVDEDDFDDEDGEDDDDDEDSEEETDDAPE